MAKSTKILKNETLEVCMKLDSPLRLALASHIPIFGGLLVLDWLRPDLSSLACLMLVPLSLSCFLLVKREVHKDKEQVIQNKPEESNVMEIQELPSLAGCRRAKKLYCRQFSYQHISCIMFLSLCFSAKQCSPFSLLPTISNSILNRPLTIVEGSESRMPM